MRTSSLVRFELLCDRHDSRDTLHRPRRQVEPDSSERRSRDSDRLRHSTFSFKLSIVRVDTCSNSAACLFVTIRLISLGGSSPGNIALCETSSRRSAFRESMSLPDASARRSIIVRTDSGGRVIEILSGSSGIFIVLSHVSKARKTKQSTLSINQGEWDHFGNFKGMKIPIKCKIYSRFCPLTLSETFELMK